ncbi:STAS domain-containing protein [Amycolatopsis sp. NPDC051102]|uniref:STAS domain-containing protein n=1 Tax=Amycolatopsis sp. NPDC051102 TaxID=3155163 RepID=UPI003448E558
MAWRKIVLTGLAEFLPSEPWRRRGLPIRARAGRLTGMGDRVEQPAWGITMPPAGTTSGVQVVMSGALGPAAHTRMRDTLRVALLTALSPEPSSLSVLLTAVTSCDGVLPEELHELAATCARENVPLRIDVSPALLPQLGSTELAPFLRLSDSTAATEPDLAVVPTWIDRATLVIAVAGELDLVTTPRMRDDIAVILAARPLRLVLDVVGVSFLASIGVNEIVRLAHVAADDAMTLHVAAGEHNRRTFELLGLADTLLRVFDTPAQALTAFGG